MGSGVSAQGSDTPASFGRYTVVRELGRGGMARVFEGRHCELGKRVAIKVLLRPDDRLAAARFVNEGRTAARIRHPNVVEVIDAGIEAGVPYLAMEFLEGVVLTHHLREVSAMSTEETVGTLIPVISAIAAAHDLGIIHRDLKPGNVMLRRRWRGDIAPTVLDFGISKQLHGLGDAIDARASDLTDSRAVLGTLPYLAPESTSGSLFTSTFSDQYAVGVMLYECITGSRPFAARGVYETMHAIVTARIVPMSERVCGVPSALEAIVLRALQRAPENRFPTMRALGAELLAFASPRVREDWGHDFPRPTDSSVPSVESRPDEIEREIPLLNEGTTRSVAARAEKARSWRRLPAAIAFGAILVTAIALAAAGTGDRRAAAAASVPTECPPTSGTPAAVSTGFEVPRLFSVAEPQAVPVAATASAKASSGLAPGARNLRPARRVDPAGPIERGTREIPIFD